MARARWMIWCGLTLVWLTAGRTGVHAADPGAELRRVIKGYGRTIGDAKKDALRKATEDLTRISREQGLQHWRPTETDVQRRFLDGAGAKGNDEPIGELDTTTWLVTLVIPDGPTLQQLDHEGLRRTLSEERMGVALRVTLAIAALLATAMACGRADEWTHGRHRRLIWLAGGVAAVAACVMVSCLP